MNPEETEPVAWRWQYLGSGNDPHLWAYSSAAIPTNEYMLVQPLYSAASLAALQAERDEAKQSGADWYYRMQRAEAQLAEARRAVKRFNSIVDAVEARCMAVDGPVTPTLQEMTETELSSLWKQTQVIRSALSDAPPLDGVGNTNGGEEQP
jgi:hypothetical protein